MGNMIKVVVFSSKLNNRPTIEVPEGATRLDLKNALNEAGINYSRLSFADGMNQQELTSDSSIITSKAGKALLTLTPRRNKAGSDLSFSQLRELAKTEPNVKNAFIKRATELGKNWTQLKTVEMNEVYVGLNRNINIEPQTKREAIKRVAKEILPDLDKAYEEAVESKLTRGLSPEMKVEIRDYVNQILLEKEELEFKAALDSMEANFTDNDEDGDYDDEDEEYYD